MEAVVVFTHEIEHWLGGLLRPGYRHVFCSIPSLHDDGTSIIVDLTVRGVIIAPAAGTSAQIAHHYRKQGLEAWLVPYTPAKRQLLPAAANSCVGLTKQLVGIRSWALTPWQLRQHLAKEHHTWSSTSPSPVLEETAVKAHHPHRQPHPLPQLK